MHEQLTGMATQADALVNRNRWRIVKAIKEADSAEDARDRLADLIAG
jgi:hypothetical protein